jgi:hypothetical protein
MLLVSMDCRVKPGNDEKVGTERWIASLRSQ